MVDEVRDLIVAARQAVASVVNATLTMLYWQICTRIRNDIPGQQRAEYGERILSTLSTKLVPEFGRGFGVRSLARMIRFAEVFPEKEILSALMTKLGCSHFLPIKNTGQIIPQTTYEVPWDGELSVEHVEEGKLESEVTGKVALLPNQNASISMTRIAVLFHRFGLKPEAVLFAPISC